MRGAEGGGLCGVGAQKKSVRLHAFLGVAFSLTDQLQHDELALLSARGGGGIE